MEFILWFRFYQFIISLKIYSESFCQNPEYICTTTLLLELCAWCCVLCQYFFIHNFYQYLAFVDCSVIVGPTGSIKCSTNYVEKGSICEVSCKKFEDFPAIPPRLHQCDVDGLWTPKLPFCAYPGQGKLCFYMYN